MGKHSNNYYRLEMETQRDGTDIVTVRKVLNGEERVADRSRYITDRDGNPYKFEEMTDAVDWLNKYIHYESIDIRYRKPKQTKFLNEAGMLEVYGSGYQLKNVVG